MLVLIYCISHGCDYILLTKYIKSVISDAQLMNQLIKCTVAISFLFSNFNDNINSMSCLSNMLIGKYL